MQLTRVRVQGFRNLNCAVDLGAPLSLIVGENNAGKSNLIDAIRLVLRPLAGPRDLWVTPEDFTHDGTGDGRGEQLEVEVTFKNLSTRQQGRMVRCLAPSQGPGVATLRVRATLGSNGRPTLEWTGGDGDTAAEDHARSAVTYTYLHPLRDALADLRPGRSNRLVALLKALIGDGPDRKQIEDIFTQVVKDLAVVPAIATARGDIQQRLDQIVGDVYAQRVDLSFSAPVLERILGNLRTLAGDQHPLELAENGLGYNNLLYMATLLAGLAKEPEGELHLLLVEEPEAHLHPQLQDLLIRYLETQASDRVQIVVTTHSPNLTSATSVERITVLARPQPSAPIAGRAVASFGLSADELGHLRRFLDVTKASLFFARGVLLVEGVAEQLLLPILADSIGLSLTRAGVAVINVGGLAFKPFAKLFHPDHLPYRCALVTDADPPSDGEATDAADGGGDPVLSSTATSLLGLQTDNLRVFLAQKTFEWDLVHAGNWDIALDALRLIRPRVATRLRDEHAESDPRTQASEVLAAVERYKGKFAQALTQLVAAGRSLQPPPYLSEALRWVAETPAITANRSCGRSRYSPGLRSSNSPGPGPCWDPTRLLSRWSWWPWGRRAPVRVRGACWAGSWGRS